MDPFETSAHSFIIKIWLDEPVGETSRAIWRGHITHVPGGERRYLDDLDTIADVIAPYLEAVGARLNICLRVRRRLKRARSFVRGRRQG